MNNKNYDNRGRLILVGVLSVIAFILVIVLFLQMTVFNNSLSDNPVSAQTTDKDDPQITQAVNKDNNSAATTTDTDNNSTVGELLATETDKTFSKGIRINGVDVSGKTLAEAKEALAGTADIKPESDVKVSFKIGDESIESRTAGLVFENDLDATIVKAFTMSENGDNVSEFNSKISVYEESVANLVHEALDSYSKEPVEPRATGFDTDSLTFIIEEGQKGTSIDFEKIIAEAKEALENGNLDLQIPVEVTVVEPKDTAEYLRSYLCKVSSTTSTTTSSSNRNTNIRLVCEKLNGLVLQPGESFDFNKYIGERTEAAGFKEAGGIYNGALRQELGGGICQANAMIFHSAVKADLQIDTRSPHTWPSDYVEIGTDATVSWGGPEFRFTNTSGYPIALHAYYGNQKVTVEIYGRPLPDGMTIKLKGEETSRTPAKVEYQADSDMELDKKVTDKSGHDAIKAKAYKIYYDADGNEIKREEAFYSSYPMINKVVRVGTRAEDGTIFKLDKETGETIAPKGYVPPTPTPTPDPEVTDDDTGSDEEPKPTKKPKDKKDKKDKNGDDATPVPTQEITGDDGNQGNGESGNVDNTDSAEKNDNTDSTEKGDNTDSSEKSDNTGSSENGDNTGSSDDSGSGDSGSSHEITPEPNPGPDESEEAEG